MGVERGIVRIPSAVAAAMPAANGADEEGREEEDAGYMYVPLGAPPSSSILPAAEAEAAVQAAFGPARHVFWPADGF